MEIRKVGSLLDSLKERRKLGLPSNPGLGYMTPTNLEGMNQLNIGLIGKIYVGIMRLS